MSALTKGEITERVVSNFFDENFSKIFSFPNPKTKTKAEVADVLIWLNRTVFLIEVKTRDEDEAYASIDSWFYSQTEKAIGQVVKNFNRIKSKEAIFLHNSYYNTDLDYEGLTQFIGLIILVYDEECSPKPSEHFLDIYKEEIPIHVFAWKDLERMIEEIDTVPDFIYYLQDRFDYLNISDIPLGQELNVLGYYKSQSNRFPKTPVNFSSFPYWENYKSSMKDQIQARNAHNQYSVWFDKLEKLFSSQRKLFESNPLGLYFAWELGALSRRERAYFGQKLASVPQWFDDGNSSRQFALQNGRTQNWLVFYFAKLPPDAAHKRLERLVELKIIKEVHSNSFRFGIYGFGFDVSTIFPHQLQGLNSAIVMGADVLKGKYTNEDIEEAYREWGDNSGYYTKKIEEFPE